MLHDEGESSTSVKRRDVEPKALLDSPAFVSSLRTTAKDPPPYGAHHCQDALWEGGNAALPPQWQQYKAPDGRLFYQDDTLIMSSAHRPLPGVRLDYHGYLVIPRCEWHISPLGLSYFINHHTRTTSWKKPTPERPAGSLTPDFLLEGHSKCIWSIAWLGTSCNIVSTSEYASIRTWTKDGEPVGEAWNSDGGGVPAIAVRPDETSVVVGSEDGRLWLWNIQKGSMIGHGWEGHDAVVWCLDWSPNALEIASGSQDGTIRRWNPDTGRKIAPPINTGHGWVYAVKHSPQGDKFASGGEDKVIRVWSKDGKLLIKMKGHEGAVTSLRWSKDGAHIFSASYDCTIRKWRSIDGKELVVLLGHTHIVSALCLSPNESHLVSASYDCSIRIWDLKTYQLVGDPLLHDDGLWALAIFPDGTYIASAGSDAKIYVWSMDAALKQQDGDEVGSADEANARPDAKLKGCVARPRDIFPPRLVSRQQASNRGLAKYGDDFWGTDTNRTPCGALPLSGPLPLLRWRNLFGFLHFTRPANTPQPIPLEPRHWNFRFFPLRISK